MYPCNCNQPGAIPYHGPGVSHYGGYPSNSDYDSYSSPNWQPGQYAQNWAQQNPNWQPGQYAKQWQQQHPNWQPGQYAQQGREWMGQHFPNSPWGQQAPGGAPGTVPPSMG